jgi:hypothetical protein
VTAPGNIFSVAITHGCEPMKSIFDRSFRYTSSAETDVRKTFARARRRIKEEEELRALSEAEAKAKVSPIIKQQKHTAMM